VEGIIVNPGAQLRGTILIVKNPAAETAGRLLFECLFLGVIPAIPKTFGSRKSF
jgi:hypothetical protein